MSNNQSTQQSSQLSKPEPPKSSRNRQLELLRNHPWLLLIVVGALLAAIAALAISSLVSIGRVTGDKPAQTTINTDETTQFGEQQPTKSANWLVAIVLLGAGSAGAVVIYRRLKSSGMPTFSWWRNAKSRLTRRQQRKLLLQQSKTTALIVEPQPVAVVESPPIVDIVVVEDNTSASELEPAEVALPLEEIVIDADLQPPVEPEVVASNLESNLQEPIVTILPPENEQAVDTRSLAEMMDIRQHLPLSTILQPDFKLKKPK